jgi:membrane peptidoglycan carboxypeptidase
VAIALLFSGPLALLKALLLALPPDFSQRWRAFLEDYDPRRRLSLASRKKEENVIYDVNGEVIAAIGASCTDGGKALDLEIPSVLQEAVVACEDRRFFRHRGIDPRGLARAVLSLSRNGGGSTITQQVSVHRVICC